MFKKNLEKKETTKRIMKSKTIKKICKKGVAFGLAGVLGMASLSGNVKAASNYTSMTGEMAGAGFVASLSMNGTSATATTIWWGVYGNIQTKARVYYWFGDSHYVTPDKETSKAFASQATAQKQLGGAEVEGAKGNHKINVNNNVSVWSGETKLGKTPAKATVLK